MLQVEVAYATPKKQVILKLQVLPGTAVAGAIEASLVRQQFAEIGLNPVVGIFSRKVSLDYQLASGDRVEIYRPLLADPKLARRQRVEQQRVEQQRAEQQRAEQQRAEQRRDSSKKRH